jgi:TatD DNase family protein
MLVDAHTHLDHYDDALLPDVLAQIDHLRMLTVAVATDPVSFERTRSLAQRSLWIIPAFGIHPWKAAQYAGDLDALEGLIEASVMLGEIGLDYYWVEDRATDDAQRRVLRHFLHAARAQHKVVNLHTKGAEAEILALLEAYRIERAIIHWYSGPLDIARRLAERGAYFTVGVELDRNEQIQTLAQQIPTGQLLTETDGPSGLEWLGGGTAMPQHVLGVVRTLARVRGVDETEMQQVIWENTRRLWGDDARLAPWTRLMTAND